MSEGGARSSAGRAVIAIDGAAGSGKSTLARRLALALGLPHVNTGTTYRAVAREALRRGIDPRDGPALSRLAAELRFSLDMDARPPTLLVDGEPPGDELLTPEVEAVVSEVSAHPEVRSRLHEAQRASAGDGGVVEGRDIGTAVLPDSDVKIFLHAGPEERAARRRAERDVPGLEAALERRDALDARVNPLVPAPDAFVVDTSGRDADAVYEEVLSLVERALAAGADESPGR